MKSLVRRGEAHEKLEHFEEAIAGTFGFNIIVGQLYFCSINSFLGYPGLCCIVRSVCWYDGGFVIDIILWFTCRYEKNLGIGSFKWPS